MKNLEQFGVQAVTSKEIMQIQGGNWIGDMYEAFVYYVEKTIVAPIKEFQSID